MTFCVQVISAFYSARKGAEHFYHVSRNRRRSPDLGTLSFVYQKPLPKFAYDVAGRAPMATKIVGHISKKLNERLVNNLVQKNSKPLILLKISGPAWGTITYTSQFSLLQMLFS